MKHYLWKNILSLTLCLILLLLLSSSALAGSFAPLNPAFIQYQEEQKFKPSDMDFNMRGRIPSPLDLSHLRGLSISEELPDYPASYDLRELGFVSAIRNQSPYGSCWTFGALASLESTTRKLLGKDLDLSERYMMYFAYIDELDLPGFDNCTSADFPWTANFGGDDYKATALLSRWTGAVLEEDAPYDDLSCIPTGFEKDAIHLQQVLYLPMDPDTRYPKADIDNIKYALTNYGAVAVGVYVDDAMAGYSPSSDYYKPSTCAAYIPEDNPDNLTVGWANHEVSIVGWDDNFASADFATQPPGDGAWIARNSWGTNWGDEGYYYLSYYDAVLDTGATYIGETPDNYRNIYQYDPLGWIISYSPVDQGDETAWFANVFTSQQTEVLKATSFYAGGVNNSYEIYIYDSIGGELICGPQAGILNEPGYHTVPLDEAVLFEKGKDLTIAVKLTTPGYEYPIAIEFNISGYSDKASALPGQSYISLDGQNWTDTTTIDTSLNVCLKAFSGPLDLYISGLENLSYTDLTLTSSAEPALEKAHETIEEILPSSLGIGTGSFNILGLMDYRVISGSLASMGTDIGIESSILPSLSQEAPERFILLLAWNYETGRFDLLSVTSSEVLSTSEQVSPIQIDDGGNYESPREEDGVLSNIKVMEVLVEKVPSADIPTSGGGGGGCSVTSLPTLLFFLIVPLMILMRKETV